MRHTHFRGDTHTPLSLQQHSLWCREALADIIVTSGGTQSSLTFKPRHNKNKPSSTREFCVSVPQDLSVKVHALCGSLWGCGEAAYSGHRTRRRKAKMDKHGASPKARVSPPASSRARQDRQAQTRGTTHTVPTRSKACFTPMAEGPVTCSDPLQCMPN